MYKIPDRSIMIALLLFGICAIWLTRFLLRLARLEQRLQRHLIGKVPSVSRVPLIGSAWQLRNFQPYNLHEKFTEYVKRFGPTFMATVFGHLIVITANRSHVEALLFSQQHLRKGSIYGALRKWLGNGLLVSRGQKWRAMRKIITPTLHFAILEQFVDVFDRQALVMVNKLRPLANGREVINIYPYMGLAALDIITETAMGVHINAQLDEESAVVQAVKDVTNILATRFMRPHLLPPSLFRLCWPSGYRRQESGIQCLHKFTNSIIEQRRQLLQQKTVNEPNDQRSVLLDTLLRATISGESLTDAQIRDEVNTFIFEGHDTTTSAASFCLYLISRHGDVQQLLFDEIQSYYGSDLQRPIVYGDFQNLPYLNCVVKESLRLYPPIPAVSRCLEQDLTIDNGCRIPANTNVIVLLWQLLRDENIYPDALSFRPERHLYQSESTSPASFISYIPFSAGPRNCIGQRFALFKVKTIVIRMLRHFQLLPLGEDVKPTIKIVLRSRSGVNFALKLRTY